MLPGHTSQIPNKPIHACPHPDPHPYFQRAFESARKALSINPSFRDGYTYLGSAEFWQAEYDLNHGRDPLPSIREAIEAYKSSLKFEPKDWEPSSNICEANNLKADYLLLTNAGTADFADARTYCENGAKFGPDMDFAQVNLGIFYANLAEFLAREHKDFRDAVRKSRAALERTLQINKEYPEAHFTLGRLEVLSGHPEKARVHLLEALRLNPKYEKARGLLQKLETDLHIDLRDERTREFLPLEAR